jgi:site-specific recombinase XerD
LSDDLALVSPGEDGQDVEGRLTSLVLNGVTSANSRRAYAAGLRQFFAWARRLAPRPFSKALVQEYRTWLNSQDLSPATVNLRLSPIRKLAQEMADNGLLDAALARGIENVPGVKQAGIRVGNWLMGPQATELLNAPDPDTLGGLRDRAILALLIGCGLRRAEILSLEVDQIQQREGRWVIPDLVGKGNRRRTVPVPSWVKVRIEEWVLAAELDVLKGKLFRPVNKGGKLAGAALSDEKAIWYIVLKYAKETSLGKLSPHDLRRTCAKLCRKAGGDLEQIQMLLGHSSIQTTERYLGTDQNLTTAVNDDLGLEME